MTEMHPEFIVMDSFADVDEISPVTNVNIERIYGGQKVTKYVFDISELKSNLLLSNIVEDNKIHHKLSLSIKMNNNFVTKYHQTPSIRHNNFGSKQRNMTFH